MAKFIIQGGKKISGEFKPAGNKNAALPMLAASLLTDEPLVLKNLPLIKDVQVMLELLSSLGVMVTQKGHTVTLCATNLRGKDLNTALFQRVRGSILLLGPLLTHYKKIDLPSPGGDVIGRRRLDTHFYGMQQLGAQVHFEKGRYLITRTTLKAASLMLDEASVTATENILMAAARVPGKTEIFNAACEPHVIDLCKLLIKMGARIEGVGTNRLIIFGRKKLKGCSYTIQPDFMEAASFMAAAAATGGALTIKGMKDDVVHRVLSHGFHRLGVEWTVTKKGWELPAKQALKISGDYGPAVPKLEDGPWPAFPSDLMSVSIVLATQAKGSILFFEKMFESRMYFVDRLIEMGARIVQCDPHRIMVVGKCPLSGNYLTSPDIRAGMAMVIAALCADGESIIENAQMIDRGYEDIETRLGALGADIVRVD